MRRETKKRLAIMALLVGAAYFFFLRPPPPTTPFGGLEGDSQSAHQQQHVENRKSSNNDEKKNEVVIKAGVLEAVKNFEAFPNPEKKEDAKKNTGVAGNGKGLVQMEVKSDPNWVYKDIDPKHLHGKIGINPDGSPAWTPIKMPPDETAEQKREHHKPNCFNLARSDSLALDRPVPDHRSNTCKTRKYPSDLPKASIVFVFFNEPFSPLFRSVHSVLNRTPPELLHEIVLVDDGSDADWLQGPLEEYIKKMPKLFLKRRGRRDGLMAARTSGAQVATGEVVVFLDSHIEVNEGWLEPMLARIKEDRNHVVMPIIESIDADSFSYYQGGIDILGFSWSLGQRPVYRSRSDSEPMKSPIMAGGLFAMDRKLFFDLGAYDEEMKLYGGEEMEIAFRIWQCGATLECIPCSKVGHIFRTSRYWQGQVYPVPGHVIVRNKLRAAAVWMDDYQFIVERVMSQLPEGQTIGNIDNMLAIRKKYNCKPFKWYLENVFPEMFVPFDSLDNSLYGEIRNPELNGCVDTMGAQHAGQTVGLYPCHQQHGTQEFLYAKDSQVIRIASLNFESCLAIDASGKGVTASGCGSKKVSDKRVIWEYDSNSQQLSITPPDSTSKMCLEASSEAQKNKSPFSLVVTQCNPSSVHQKWVFNPNLKK